MIAKQKAGVFEIILSIFSIVVALFGFVLISKTFVQEGTMGWLMVIAIFLWFILLVLFIFLILIVAYTKQILKEVREMNHLGKIRR